MKRRSGFRFGSRRPPLLDTWRRVAGELGGEVTVDRQGRAKRLYVPHGLWVTVTDKYTESHGEGSSSYTRVRALFVRGQPFGLKVSKRNPLHLIGHLIGYRSVPMRYAQLDRSVFVRSDRPDLARAMLRGTSLGQSLMREPVRLIVGRPDRKIRRAAGDTVGEVRLLKVGFTRDVAVLRGMIQQCMQTLDELHRLRVATADAVDTVAL